MDLKKGLFLTLFLFILQASRNKVCQEAVWEAFQIFLDRVPDTTEFQQWVHACLKNSLCVEDLAHNFSSTQEHIEMVSGRVDSIQDSQDYVVATSVPGKKCLKIPQEKTAMDSETTKLPSAVQHTIEFSVTLKDTDDSTAQRDPESVQYQDIPHSLNEQMLQIFTKLAGFKEIRLLGIDPGSVAARYAVVFETEVNSTGIQPPGIAGESGTETALKDVILKALREETSLPLEIHFISFEPTSQNNIKDWPTAISQHIPGVISTQAAVAISEEITESIISSEEKASPNGAQRKDDKAIKNTFPTQETSKHLPTVTTLVTITESSPPEPSDGSKLKKTKEQDLIAEVEGYEKNTSGTLDSTSNVSEVEKAVGSEIAAMSSSSLKLNSIKAVRVYTSNQHSESLVDVSKASIKDKISIMPHFIPTEVPKEDDTADAGGQMSIDVNSDSHETSNFTGTSQVTNRKEHLEVKRFSSEPKTEGTTIQHKPVVSIPQSSVDLASLSSTLPGNSLNKEDESIQSYSSHQIIACDNQESESDEPKSSNLSLDKDVGVFFSLKLMNMVISEDLNRSSSGYKFLENTFLELRHISESSELPNPKFSSKQAEKEQRTLTSIPLLHFLQSNLTGFKELHVLNFRNGGVVYDKIMLAKPVVDNITKAVHCSLVNVSNTAAKRMDYEIEFQSADHGDPCKYMNCNEFSHCVVNTPTSEAECLCDPGYSSVDGLPCQSICNLQPNYCGNGGLCENIPGYGASCRCPAGKYWYYDGERCNDLVSVPVNPFIFVICLMGSLTVVCAVIGMLVLINRKCIRTRRKVTLVHSGPPLSMERIMRVNPAFENDDTLTHVSSISYPTITDSSSSQPSDQGSFYSLENMQLSIEVPRQLYTTRSEKLLSEIVDFQHCIPHVETWRLSNEHRPSCCLLRGSDSDGFEVTVL